MITIEQAKDFLLAEINRVKRTQWCCLEDACDRVLVSDVLAPIHVPPHNNSAMDGVAFAFKDYLALQDETSFAVSDKIFAGKAAKPLVPNTAVRIFTGAIIPEGADTVVLQEDCHFFEDRQSQKRVEVLAEAKAGANIRLAGEDIRQGEVVVVAGTQLNARSVALLASVGVSKVEVYALPRVSLLATGDELIYPGEALMPGQIYNSNLYLIKALLENMGCVVDSQHVCDDLSATTRLMQNAINRADMLLTIGGVSVGEADFVKEAITSLGRLELWKVAMKPGKPLSFGHISNSDLSIPVLGLPGNPVSAFTSFQLFAVPMIRSLKGENVCEDEQELLPIILNQDKQVKRDEFLRVQRVIDQGAVRLKPFSHQGSGVMSSVVWATGFARLPAKETIKSGDLVKYYPFV